MNAHRLPSPWLVAGLLSVVTIAAAGSARAVPTAADFRSGVVGMTGAGGLTTTPLFVVPTGFRFVLTDVFWTEGKYPTAPGSNPDYQAGVWLQDQANNVRWMGGTSSSSAGFNYPIQHAWTTGLVFQENQIVTFGISFPGTAVDWSVSWSGYVEALSVSAVEPGPDRLALEAFPNPSGERVLFQFRLDRAGKTALAVFDSKGRRIRSLVEDVRSPGWQVVEWDAKDDRGRSVPSGQYFVRLRTGTMDKTEKIIRLD